MEFHLSCQAAAAGEQGEASLSEQIELATKATPLSAQIIQCAAAERISGPPACSVLPYRPPRPWEHRVPSEVQGAHGIRHRRLAGSGAIMLRASREGRGRTWLGRLHSAKPKEPQLELTECM